MTFIHTTRQASDMLRPRILDYGGRGLTSAFIARLRSFQVPSLVFLLTLPLLFVVDGLTSQSLAQDRTAPEHPQLVAALETRLIAPTPTNLAEIKRRIGYPAIASQSGLAGTVVAEMLVDESGHVVRWKAAGAASPILKAAVAEHLPALTFTPGSRAGKALKLWVTIDFVFRVN